MVRVNVILYFHSFSKEMQSVSPVPMINETQGDSLSYPKGFQKYRTGLRKLVDHA